MSTRIEEKLRPVTAPASTISTPNLSREPQTADQAVGTKLAFKPPTLAHAAFLTAGQRVLGGLRVPFGRPGLRVVAFGGLAGVPRVARSR